MRLSPLTRSALVLIPLLLCANRIHAQRTANMQGMTQEVNRCLTIVRVAASRRRNPKSQDAERFGAAGVVTDGAAALGPAPGRRKSA
jgi:hypothetical protein